MHRTIMMSNFITLHYYYTFHGRYPYAITRQKHLHFRYDHNYGRGIKVRVATS